MERSGSCNTKIKILRLITFENFMSLNDMSPEFLEYLIKKTPFLENTSQIFFHIKYLAAKL